MNESVSFLFPQAVPYLAIFEQGGSTDIFSLITGGGRDDTFKSIIVTLSNLGGGQLPLSPHPLGTALIGLVS